MLIHFNVISSNIRFDNPADKDHAWPYRLPVIKKVITDFNTHILGTQEGRRPQIIELANNLESLSLIDEHRDWIDERMYPCIFIDQSIFTRIISGDIWLSETPKEPATKFDDSAFPRLCTWAHLKVNEIQTEFLVVNTHLDHVQEETRNKQISVLVRELKKVNQKNLPVIYMGDFNSCPDNETYKSIMSSSKTIYDPWKKLGHSEESSYHKFCGANKEGCRIDWILLEKEFRCEEISLDKSHIDDIYPSDHFPVKAKIKLL